MSVHCSKSFDLLIAGFFMLCQQHRPYLQQEFLNFNSDSTFRQYVKAKNQFVLIDTYKKEILDISQMSNSSGILI